MTTNNNPSPKPPPAALTNHYFPAINLSFPFFQQKAADSFYKNMQNKPNLNISIFMLTSFEIGGYLSLDTWYGGKNESNSNPIQTQYKPIQSQFFSPCPINHNQAFHLINQARFGYASNVFFFL
jgi:hypothetical protein